MKTLTKATCVSIAVVAAFLTLGLGIGPETRLLRTFTALAAPAPPQNPTGPPSSPIAVSPVNGATGTSVSPALDVSVVDPAGSDLSVTFYGRVANTVGQNFSIVVLPDTQYYSSGQNGGTPAMFNTQTQWIVNNQSALNIAYVAHLGDIVQSGNNNGNNSEWTNADTALKILEAGGIPYGLPPGNHDEGANLNDNGNPAETTGFNTWFGVSRYSGRSYYGGHYSTTNDNHYDLISAGGMDFVVIYFAYDTSATGARFQGVLSWANRVLKQYSNRHAILVSHYILNSGNPATFGTQGQMLFNTLSPNSSLFMLHSGHIHSPTGMGQRTDTVNGNVIQSIMSDFQGLTNGGNGWLRILTFSPASNQIQVKTYSPVLNQYMTDSANQFTVPWNMQQSGYTNLGTVSNVASGAHATLSWNNVTAGVQYEWYAVASNGAYSTTSPTWNFTTAAIAAPKVNLSATSLAFGSQALNQSSAPQSVLLTNIGGAELNISGINATGDYSTTNTCGNQLAMNASCTIAVTFSPTVAGPHNNTLSISDDATGSPHTINLTGTGVATSAPSITSASTIGFTAGSAGTFTVTATGFPVPALSQTGALPAGVTFVAGTGKLSGTPSAGTAGSYPITFTAHNGIGSDATQSFTLTVSQPVVVSAAFVRAAGNAGQSVKYTVNIAPTGGDFLAVFVWQVEGAATPSAMTDNLGNVYTKDCDLTYNQGFGSRRVTVYHLVNAPSGITGISITPNRPSRAIVAEYAGMPTSGTVLDVCGTVKTQTTASKSWTSNATVTSSNDLVIGLEDTGFTGNAGYSATGTWTGRLAQHDATDGDDSYFEDQIGVIAGSYTAAGATTASVAQSSVVVAFKTSLGPAAPVITSASNTAFAVGTAGSFTVTATGFPSPALSESGALPSGVAFNTATGVLSGTPAAATAGSYPITFTAQNGVAPNSIQSFTLTVNPPSIAPTITSPNVATFSVGTAATFSVTTTGTPTPTLSATGTLPTGVTFNPGAGTLSGTPVPGTGGAYSLTITAQNGVNPTATQNFTLTVNQVSAITSAITTGFTVGSAGTFTVTASGFPVPTLSEAGALPAGVTFVAGTGKLSGTPSAGTAGSYPITFTAHNGIGSDATQSFTLTVSQPVVVSAAYVRAAGNAGQSVKYTVNIAPTGGNFLAVFVWQVEGAATPSAMTDNLGNVYTKDCDLTYNQGFGSRRVTVYHLMNAPSGITGISITPNRPSRAIVAEYAGMPTSGTVLDVCGTVKTQTTASKSWTSNATVTSSNDLVIGLEDTGFTGNAGYSATGTWTGRLAQHDATDGDDSYFEDQIGVIAGSYTAAGATTASVAQSSVIVAFKTGH